MEISELDKELFMKYAKFIFGESFPNIQCYEDLIRQRWDYLLISNRNNSCIFIESVKIDNLINNNYRAIKIVDLWPEFKKYLLLK